HLRRAFAEQQGRRFDADQEVVLAILMRIDRAVSDHPGNRTGIQHERGPIETPECGRPTHQRTPRESEAEKNLRPIGDAFHVRIDDDYEERGEARHNREAIELEQDQETDECLRQHENGGLRDGDLTRRNRPRARAFDEAIEITINQIIPGATGAAHCKGTDEKQDDVPRARETAGMHSGKTDRPPAWHQEQPRTDRTIEAGKSQIGAAVDRRETIDPISGRIGNASGRSAHFPIGLPVKVSNVPRPVLMLLEFGTGLVSASLKVGPDCCTGAAAAWQTRVRISEVLAMPALRFATICAGMPHQTPLSTAYFNIFV